MTAGGKKPSMRRVVDVLSLGDLEAASLGVDVRRTRLTLVVAATVGTAACAREDHYYDAITTTYQLYARTGTLTHLVNARRWGCAVTRPKPRFCLSSALYLILIALWPSSLPGRWRRLGSLRRRVCSRS